MLIEENPILSRRAGRESVEEFRDFLKKADWKENDNEANLKKGKDLIRAIYQAIGKPMPNEKI